MKLSLYNLNQTEDVHSYNKALDALEDAHPFYKVSFLDIFYDGLQKAKAFVLYNESQHPLVVMPFYLREIPFDLNKHQPYFDIISTWGYSGPLYNVSTSKEILKRFWNLVDKWYSENNIVSEFIRFNNHENILEYTGQIKATMQIVKGELLPEEILWNNYNRKVRKNINRAVREQLTTKIFFKDIDKQVMDDFHRIFFHTMERTDAKSQYYNNKEKLFAFIKDFPQNVAIVLTYLENTPISSEMVLLSSDSMFSFLGGTLSDYFDLRPNEILKHNMNKWGFQNGFKHYILGGGLGQDDGIFKYKVSFFPNDAKPFFTGRKIVNQDIYNQFCEKTNQNLQSDEFFPMYRKQN